MLYLARDRNVFDSIEERPPPFRVVGCPLCICTESELSSRVLPLRWRQSHVLLVMYRISQLSKPVGGTDRNAK
jgi:hypothetical protein